MKLKMCEEAEDEEVKVMTRHVRGTHGNPWVAYYGHRHLLPSFP